MTECDMSLLILALQSADEVEPDRLETEIKIDEIYNTTCDFVSPYLSNSINLVYEEAGRQWLWEVQKPHDGQINRPQSMEDNSANFMDDDSDEEMDDILDSDTESDEDSKSDSNSDSGSTISEFQETPASPMTESMAMSSHGE